MYSESPRLYAIAKMITLEAGMPYTDPRTGVTTQPPKVAAKKAAPKRKVPKKGTKAKSKKPAISRGIKAKAGKKKKA